MNRPQRNSNPINLMFKNQHGALRADKDGFAVFSSDVYGWKAAIKQIKLDQSRNLTIREFSERFAPPATNDTEKYIRWITSSLDTKDDEKLEHLNPYALAGVMAAWEGYFAGEKTE